MTKNAGTGTSGDGLLDIDLELPGMEALAASGDVPPPSGDVVGRALAAVRAAAEREQAGAAAEAGATGASAPRRVRRRTLTVGAVLAGVAAAAILPTVSIGGSRPTAAAQAADFLNAMATKASGPDLGNATYWKVSLLVGGDQPPAPVNEYYSRTTFTTEMVGFPAARKTLQAKPGTSTLWFGDTSNAVRWDDLPTLPTDPSRLARRLVGDWGARGAFMTVGSLLGTAPISPDVRTAVYQVLARTPGVRLLGTTHDAAGRAGKALAVTYGAGTANPETETMIIDPATGRLLQQEYRSRTDDNRFTYLSQGPVDRIG